MKIINLTQHVTTEAQIKDGVFEPSDKNAVKNLLTFTTIPSKEDIVERAKNWHKLHMNIKQISLW